MDDFFNDIPTSSPIFYWRWSFFSKTVRFVVVKIIKMLFKEKIEQCCCQHLIGLRYYWDVLIVLANRRGQPLLWCGADCHTRYLLNLLVVVPTVHWDGGLGLDYQLNFMHQIPGSVTANLFRIGKVSHFEAARLYFKNCLATGQKVCHFFNLKQDQVLWNIESNVTVES